MRSRCLPRRIPLDSGMVSTLKGGANLTVVLENAVGQKKTLQLSLSGITAGLNALAQ